MGHGIKIRRQDDRHLMILNSLIPRLPSPAEEEAFRLHSLRHDKILSILAMSLMFFPALYFIKSDYLLFAGTATFYHLLTARIIYISISVTLIIIAVKTENPVIFDRANLAFLLSICGIIIIVNLSRPPQYVNHSIIDILIVIFMYLVVPARQSHRIITALLLTGANITMIMVRHPGLPPLAFNVLVVSYTLATLLGIVILRSMQVFRRREYSALMEQRRISSELEEALHNVKTLQGLIPLCSSCKKVRDDRGYWNMLEEYLASHTNAIVTHGICDDCAKKLYGHHHWYNDKEDNSKNRG